MLNLKDVITYVVSAFKYLTLISTPLLSSCISTSFHININTIYNRDCDIFSFYLGHIKEHLQLNVYITWRRLSIFTLLLKTSFVSYYVCHPVASRQLCTERIRTLVITFSGISYSL